MQTRSLWEKLSSMDIKWRWDDTQGVGHIRMSAERLWQKHGLWRPWQARFCHLSQYINEGDRQLLKAEQRFTQSSNTGRGPRVQWPLGPSLQGTGMRFRWNGGQTAYISRQLWTGEVHHWAMIIQAPVSPVRCSEKLPELWEISYCILPWLSVDFRLSIPQEKIPGEV